MAVVPECIATILFFMLILQLAGRCFPKVLNLSWQALVAKAVICIAALLVVISDRKVELHMRISLEGFIKTGWYILVASALFLILQLISAYDLPSPSRFIMFAAFSLGTAVSEELIFRGLVSFRLKEEWGKKESTVFFSALLFALVHLSNLISNPTLVVSSTTQVAYTFSLGMMLTYSYYETDNLIVPVLLHFLFNTLSAFSSAAVAATAPVAAGDIGAVEAAILMSVMCPGILWTHVKTKRWKTDMEHSQLS